MGIRSSNLIDYSVKEKARYPEIYDLEYMVNQWVLNEYYQNKEFSVCVKKKRKKRRPPAEILTMYVDYNDLHVIHNQPVYQYSKDARTSENEVASSNFENNSYSSQQHNFSTHQLKMYAYTYTINRGMAIGDTTKLKVKLPEDFLVDNVHLPELVDIDKVDMEITNTFQQDLGVDHIVTVPPLTKITARLLITEKQYSTEFSIRSTLSGYITVTLKDKNNKHVAQYISNISTIVRDSMCNITCNEDGGFIMLPDIKDVGGNEQFMWDVTRNKVHFQSKGYCSFCYLKEKQIKTDVERLNCVMLTLNKVLEKFNDL